MPVLKRMLLVLCAILFFGQTGLAQPVEDWSVLVSGDGIIVASPLLMDVYFPPPYPLPGNVGEEVFVTATLSNNSRYFSIRPDGASSYIDFPETIVQASAVGAAFPGSPIPRLFMGSSEGMWTMWQNFPMNLTETADQLTSTPMLVNLDSDSEMEIIAVDNAGTVYAWNFSSGGLQSVGGNFPLALNGAAAYLSPATGSINSSNDLEIVVATENQIIVLSADGDTLSGWPRPIDATVIASPAIGKIDSFNDGTRNVVFATDDGKVHVRRSGGSPIVGWPKDLQASIDTAPVIADINLDAKLEILIGTTDGMFHALQGNGNELPGWPVDLSGVRSHLAGEVDPRRDMRTNTQFMDPLVADVNGDFKIEVLVPISNDAALVAIQADGTLLTDDGWPILMGYDAVGGDFSNFEATPALSDIDLDGLLEVVGGTTADPGSNAFIKAYELGPLPANAPLMQWTHFRRDRSRHAAVPTPTQDPLGPNCNFPSHLYAPTGAPLIIDFADWTTHPNLADSTWTCSIKGATELSVTYLNNHTIAISNPDGWVGTAAVTLTVIDPDWRYDNDTTQLVGIVTGDIDADGQVTMADMSQLIGFVLGQSADDFEQTAGDVNGDGSLDIRDVLGILALID